MLGDGEEDSAEGVYEKGGDKERDGDGDSLLLLFCSSFLLGSFLSFCFSLWTNGLGLGRLFFGLVLCRPTRKVISSRQIKK